MAKMKLHPEGPWFHPAQKAIAHTRTWGGIVEKVRDAYYERPITFIGIVRMNRQNWFRQANKQLRECYEYIRPF